MALCTVGPLLRPKPRVVLFFCFLALVCAYGLVYSGIGSGSSFLHVARIQKEWALRKGTEENVKEEVKEVRRGPRVLLVTALYPLEKSKHTDEEYAEWLELFLSRIETDTYFYAPEKMRKQITSAAAKLDTVSPSSKRRFTLNTTYPTIFSVPPLVGLQSTYEEMHSIDREKDIHGAELYAVWNAKAFFLDEAVKYTKKTQNKEYDYAFWIDAGSFRNEHRYSAWPDPQQVETIFKSNEDRVFLSISRLPSQRGMWWREDMGPFDEDVSQGSFFGGKPSAITWFRNTFYAYHDYYLSKSFFVGKDQTIFNSLFLLFPHRFLTMWKDDPEAPARQELAKDLANAGLSTKILSIFPQFLSDVGYLGRCNDNWYYYHFFLADDATREKMRDLWDSQYEEKAAGWKGALGLKGSRWMEHTRCRNTRSLRMEELFGRRFGETWVPPQATVVESS